MLKTSRSATTTSARSIRIRVFNAVCSSSVNSLQLDSSSSVRVPCDG